MALRVLIPTRGRAHRVPIVAKNLAETAPDARVTWIVDPDDPASVKAVKRYNHVVNPKPHSSWAIKINLGLEATNEPVMFFGADDVIYHPGWADPAPEVDGMVGTRDLLNGLVEAGLHATHWFVDRDYAMSGGLNFDKTPGLAECYAHNYVDNEAIVAANYHGKFRHEPTSIVEHCHHLNGKAPHDQTYAHGDASKGRDMYVHHQRLYSWLRDLP